MEIVTPPRTPPAAGSPLGPASACPRRGRAWRRRLRARRQRVRCTAHDTADDPGGGPLQIAMLGSPNPPSSPRNPEW